MNSQVKRPCDVHYNNERKILNSREGAIFLRSVYYTMMALYGSRIRVFAKASSSLLSSHIADSPLTIRVASYHENVIKHFEKPQNVGSLDKNDADVGTGLVGAPACGDVMKLQIKVDENGKIIDAKFKTFGCASAIASSSLATEWVKGKSVEDAYKVKNTDIAKELCLPPVKLHCSMLAEDAIKAALNDYKVKRSAAGPPARKEEKQAASN
ncbi:Iron-sulfur cluster assembly enzyme ISCU, mitochondrial [Hypsibius exemplaris]|uniref:Iron-sulfur cluster assembly enzyme ISCU n=1 Tax=Hypsibius exemplaris TaxID=2072580 RepID=A0A1W0X2N5_HYPEX|nr:Iron-sulfur cluster assembly enzyme ISCU, mitochondrial [Hypsibius exemplaris]